MGTATGTRYSSSTNLQQWDFPTPSSIGDKLAALDELFRRIAPVARAMGGKLYLGESDVALETAMVFSPQSERAPSLHVEMASGLVADFAPSRPLSIEGVLSVRARRWFHVSRKADRTFTFLKGEWFYTCINQPLTEDHIRQCLAIEGPLLSL